MIESNPVSIGVNIETGLKMRIIRHDEYCDVVNHTGGRPEQTLTTVEFTTDAGQKVLIEEPQVACVWTDGCGWLKLVLETPILSVRIVDLEDRVNSLESEKVNDD